MIVSPGLANDAAHSLAERFAQDAESSRTTTSAPSRSDDRDRRTLERKLQQEERLRADEAEMLERARTEQAERSAAEDKAADEARVAAERTAHEEAETKRLAAEKAEAERLAAETAAAASLAAQQKAVEDEAADQAARERAARESARIKAAEERRKTEEKQATDRKLAEEKAEAERQAQNRKLAEEKAETDRREAEAARERIAAAKQADAQRRMEAEREAEAKRLSEKLQRAREQRAAKDLGQGYSALGAPMPGDTATPPGSQDLAARPAAGPEATHNAAEPAGPSNDAGARATILLIMQPGTRGIRRHEKTGDPIVCSGSRCFISEGTENPAKTLTRARAFGAGNTLGQRAGACRHALVCTFRDIDVGAETFALQAVDMRILRHDRREPVTADVDHTCRMSAGRLYCAEPVNAGSYRAWIVPEKLARKAGPDALAAALEAGLPPPPVASGAWR